MMVMVISDDWPHNFDSLAKDLGIPSNTLRRYFKLYQEYIPNKLAKRGTRFNKESKELFETINKMYSQRMTTEEIMRTIAATRMPTIDVRPSPPSQPAQAPDLQSPRVELGVIAALLPLAERYLAVYERQTKALEAIAAGLAHNRPFGGFECRGDTNPHPDHETGQEGADIKPARTRGEIIAEVHRLRGLGWGAARIRTAMVKAGWPSLAGPGHRLSKSTVARIIKGEISN